MDWKSRIDRQFEAGLFDSITIGGVRGTREITNFEYALVPEELKDLVPAPVDEEIIERDFIIKRSTEMYDQFLSKDISSRQGAFVNNYDGQDNHCISYFHHYVRDSKYSLNIYVRSMDYKRNFIFDNQTFNLAYSEVFKRISKDNLSLMEAKGRADIKSGYIRVFVFSLHEYI
jgi:hypothetical protein